MNGTKLNQYKTTKVKDFPVSFDYHIHLQSITSVIFPDQLIFQQKLSRFFLSTFVSLYKLLNRLLGLCFLQSHNERTGLLVRLLVGLKTMLGGSTVQHPTFHLKEALKKARKHVPISFSNRPLCRAKSYVSLDEMSTPLPSEKEPTTNTDQIEPVERMEEQRAPCTCVDKPLVRSIPCLDTEESIIAAPSEFRGLPSWKKKTKIATPLLPLLQNSNRMNSSFLICIAIPMLLSVGGIVFVSYFMGEYFCTN